MERMHGWVGRQDRFPVEVEAVVHRADGTDLSVVVSNISDEGCRLEGAEIFTIGERLTIAIPRIGTVSAQIALGPDRQRRRQVHRRFRILIR